MAGGIGAGAESSEVELCKCSAAWLRLNLLPASRLRLSRGGRGPGRSFEGACGQVEARGSSGEVDGGRGGEGEATGRSDAELLDSRAPGFDWGCSVQGEYFPLALGSSCRRTRGAGRSRRRGRRRRERTRSSAAHSSRPVGFGAGAGGNWYVRLGSWPNEGRGYLYETKAWSSKPSRFSCLPTSSFRAPRGEAPPVGAVSNGSILSMSPFSLDHKRSSTLLLAPISGEVKKSLLQHCARRREPSLRACVSLRVEPRTLHLYTFALNEIGGITPPSISNYCPLCLAPRDASRRSQEVAK